MVLRQSASHSGLQPKGDYDTPVTCRFAMPVLSHSGLQPKGDYDQRKVLGFSVDTVGRPIADFSRKAIMTRGAT